MTLKVIGVCCDSFHQLRDDTAITQPRASKTLPMDEGVRIKIGEDWDRTQGSYYWKPKKKRHTGAAYMYSLQTLNSLGPVHRGQRGPAHSVPLCFLTRVKHNALIHLTFRIPCPIRTLTGATVGHPEGPDPDFQSSCIKHTCKHLAPPWPLWKMSLPPQLALIWSWGNWTGANGNFR